ncbi:hypothetical protein [Nitrospira sp. Ecomares 2.1]
MSEISSVIAQLAYLDIFGEVTNTKIDIRGWVANQSYLIDENISADSFVLRVNNTPTLKAAIANDCNRMAMASFETMAGIQKEPRLPRSGAWGIIRSYYAAFFAAHTVLRLFGRSCSQLEAEHLKKIYEMAVALNKEGEVRKIESGFYYIHVAPDFGTVSFKKIKDSHKDTWGSFLKLVEEIIKTIETTAALGSQKLAARDLLVMIRDGITKSGCKGNWLSMIRNQVNYQHTLGVWYPYENKAPTGDYLQKVSEYWKKSPSFYDLSDKPGDLECFFELGALLLSFSKFLLISCSKKSFRVNKIFGNGTLKLLNEIKAV